MEIWLKRGQMAILNCARAVLYIIVQVSKICYQMQQQYAIWGEFQQYWRTST